MRKRIFTWLGKEFVELSGEAKAAANATIEAQELFQRIDQELKQSVIIDWFSQEFYRSTHQRLDPHLLVT